MGPDPRKDSPRKEAACACDVLVAPCNNFALLANLQWLPSSHNSWFSSVQQLVSLLAMAGLAIQSMILSQQLKLRAANSARFNSSENSVFIEALMCRPIFLHAARKSRKDLPSTRPLLPISFHQFKVIKSLNSVSAQSRLVPCPIKQSSYS